MSLGIGGIPIGGSLGVGLGSVSAASRALASCISIASFADSRLSSSSSAATRLPREIRSGTTLFSSSTKTFISLMSLRF
jgi:hypothetical protein